MSTELTWLGHGTWLIKTGGKTILLDPFLDDNPAAPLKAADLFPDYILVSHAHDDHIADLVSIAKRTEALIVTSHEIAVWASGQGCKKTHGMNLGGSFKLPCGTVKQTLAFHSSTFGDGTAGGNPCGWLLTLPEGKVYFACDTALFSDMSLIGDEGLALAVLPIGDNYTMGPEDSIKAVKLLRPKRVAPAHYNTWPPIAQDPVAWAERVKHETSCEPIVLSPGETILLT